MFFCKRTVRFIKDIYCYLILSRLAGIKLKHLIVKCDGDVECLVKLPFIFEYKHPLFTPIVIKPVQVYEEILYFSNIANTINPKRVLEIGTASGGTLFLFTIVADPEATIISIDLPSGPFGGGYPRWRIPLYKSFARESQRIFLIRANSHNPETLKTVKRILKDEKIDLLFIDGDHTYEGVKKDFEMYNSLVRKGGIIAFHDIVPGPLENVGGVPRFWCEVKDNYMHLEIVRNWEQGGYGIGVVYV